MADVTVTDSNYTSAVKSSYDDVNSALENLLGNVGSGSYASKSDIANLQNQLNNFVGTNPVGTILPFGTSTVPNGYLLCNGASFDSSKYAALYSAISSSTLPDMRGMFLRGLDTSGAVDRDGATRALLSFQEGSRLLNDWGASVAGFYQGNGNYTDSNPDSMKNVGWDPRANTSQNYPYSAVYSNLANSSSSLSNSNNTYDMVGIARPKNVAVNYIIKAVP